MLHKQITADPKSKEYKYQLLNFIISKMPVKLSPHHHNQFENYFKGFDQDRKGYLSLQQVFTGIKEYLNLEQLFQAKIAVQRSFQKAVILQNLRHKQEFTQKNEVENVKSNINKKKDIEWVYETNELLTKKGFWYFLLILCRQYELLVMFDMIDQDKNGKLTIQEFEHALPQFQEWGYNSDEIIKEFYNNSQNMSGVVFYDEFCKWADDNKLKMYDNSYVVETLQQHFRKYKFPQNDLNLIFQTKGQSVILQPGQIEQPQDFNQEKIKDKHYQYFRAKILNEDKKLQVFKINKKSDVNQSLNEQQQQILDEIQIDQEIEKKLQQLSYEQKLQVKENLQIKSIEKSIKRVQNQLENPEISKGQLKIAQETMEILKQQLRNIKRTITFNLAEKNDLHEKILKEIFDFYVSTDVYRTEHRRKKALESDVLSKKQFLNFTRQFPFLETKKIKMEIIQKILNFNITEKEHTGLTYKSFRKCIEMIGAYMFSTEQDNRQETTENLQQVYNLMGFYNHTYKIYMGLPLPLHKQQQYQNQYQYMGGSSSINQSINYNDYTLNLNPNNSINLHNEQKLQKQHMQQQQQNENQGKKQNQNQQSISEYVNTQNNESSVTTSKKINVSKSIKTSHGYNLNKIQSQKSVKPSLKKILPDDSSNQHLYTVSQESIDDSLAFSNVSEIQEQSQVLEDDQHELQHLSPINNGKNGQYNQQFLDNSQNLNNSLLNESGRRISFSKLQEDTKKNVNYFSKVMLREEQDDDMYDSKQKIELKYDQDNEDPFLHLDSMLNQRKKVKEIFYFYTKQKQGYHTFDRILHEINVFSLGQFSQFCRQFQVLQDRRKEIPRVFKKAGVSPKELTLKEFENLLEVLAQEKYADSDLYKTREEKILAFYNYLGFDIHNTYRQKLILLKKPFNIDVDEGYRLLEKDRLKYKVKSKDYQIKELRELENQHQQEMRRLHQKQLQEQYEQRQSVLLMKQQDEKLQQQQANKNAMFNKKTNPILASNYFQYDESKGIKNLNSKSVENSKKQWYSVSQPKLKNPPTLFQNKSQVTQEFNNNNNQQVFGLGQSISTTKVSKSKIQLGKGCKMHNSVVFPSINLKQQIIENLKNQRYQEIQSQREENQNQQQEDGIQKQQQQQQYQHQQQSDQQHDNDQY